MILNDPLGDLLTRIRNALRAGQSATRAPMSKLRTAVLDVLQREGYIRGYTVSNLRPGVDELTIELKYSKEVPAIREISRISKPGRRVYTSVRDLRGSHNDLGITILSTSKGVLSDYEARTENVGGEVLCRVF